MPGPGRVGSGRGSATPGAVVILENYFKIPQTHKFIRYNVASFPARWKGGRERERIKNQTQAKNFIIIK